MIVKILCTCGGTYLDDSYYLRQGEYALHSVCLFVTSHKTTDYIFKKILPEM